MLCAFLLLNRNNFSVFHILSYVQLWKKKPDLAGKLGLFKFHVPYTTAFDEVCPQQIFAFPLLDTIDLQQLVLTVLTKVPIKLFTIISIPGVKTTAFRLSLMFNFEVFSLSGKEIKHIASISYTWPITRILEELVKLQVSRLLPGGLEQIPESAFSNNISLSS